MQLSSSFCTFEPGAGKGSEVLMPLQFIRLVAPLQVVMCASCIGDNDGVEADPAQVASMRL